ncbi:kelch-like protein 10 [Sander lucioperca]|uniref:Kelch like family member 10 n=1 Tax=Sander lucioperca TaxID=283035 RepID=A0A8D0D0X6_SANLU|nr:kelch-like protein 10 [Sander lucioperca]
MSTIFFNNTINELRLEGKLCDAVITVDDVEFKVHRIILCNCGSYFRDIFLSKSSTSGQQVYSFSQVSPNIMNLIVEYAYTGSVVVTEENVLELLAGADYFSVKGIMQACCNFVEQHLSFKNCVHMWMLADIHKCPELRQKAYLHMLHHFKEVTVFSLKFLQLSVEQLADLIKKDELNARQESTVFEAVLRWIEYAPEERRCHMATLLSKVRLLLMSSEYLMDRVSTNALVTKSPLCTKMVIQAMKTLRESNTNQPLTRTRLPSAVLFAIGGWANDCPTNRIELYNVRADRWVKVHNEEAPRAFYGCVCLNGFVYCIGGYDGLKYLSSVRKLNLVTQTWQDVGPMHAVRCYVSVVALNGCIYAMGGCDGDEKLKTAERYQPDISQWTLIAPMNEKRSNAGTATLHGKVYICGGFKRTEPLSSAECYNPDTNQWTLIASMEIGCNAARAAAYKDRIYVIGGYRNSSHVSRVIAYDPLSNQWSMVNPMIHARSSFGIAVLEDQLYVAGGFDNHGTLSKVERFDEEVNRWHIVRDMKMSRSGLSCCVVDRYPCATAYL